MHPRQRQRRQRAGRAGPARRRLDRRPRWSRRRANELTARNLVAKRAGGPCSVELRRLDLAGVSDEFDRAFVDEIAALLDRRSDLSISVTERELYLDIRSRTFIATIAEHHT